MSTLPVTHNMPEYSVSEIAQALKRTVEDRFGYVRVRGEISAFKVHTSGHAYFRLKDSGAVIDAVCWKGTLGKVGCRPEEGLEVIASGRVTTYPGKSTYQIVVERMEPAGVGALMQLLERRKKQFEAEGLFDKERKKLLPFLPQTIGVITSPTGAVIRDILHRLRERFPCHVLLWPVLVQGEGAAEQVAAAIEGFNGMAQRPDVLIVARGGGSIEDLWAFNEESVVRAVAASSIPVISAVGHETDTTLIDFVSDKRAPTPTAAAEMAVPVREDLIIYTEQMQGRLIAAVFRTLSERQEKLTGLARGLPKPAQFLDHAAQRLDDWSERLSAALPARIEKSAQTLAVLAAHLKPQLLLQELGQWSRRLSEWGARLTPPALRLIDQRGERLSYLEKLLSSVSHERVLARGFALVKDAQGKLVTCAVVARQETELTLIFKDGEVKASPSV